MKPILSLLAYAVVLFTIIACGQKAQPQQQVVTKNLKYLDKYSRATFAAGCFWHEEALFESVKGVVEVISGYAGGKADNPNYESLESNNNGHAETVEIYYDTTLIDYPTLLNIYFAGQDPTQVNGQGNDRGTQYRSIIFFRNSTEADLATAKMSSMREKYTSPLTVQLVPFTRFWVAEKIHQNYITNNPYGNYVQNVSIPEIKLVQQEYPNLIKPDHFY